MVGRDDLRRSRSKEGHRGHPPRDAYRSPDSIHSVTSLSPQQPDEELDLCPPAAGISSLDFDPMSFQCSQPSAAHWLQQQQQQQRERERERGKWRKSAGCSSESEPISSPNNNNNISRTQSPDISPGLCQGRETAKPHQRWQKYILHLGKSTDNCIKNILGKGKLLIQLLHSSKSKKLQVLKYTSKKTE